jgi:hypothetical protein
MHFKTIVTVALAAGSALAHPVIPQVRSNESPPIHCAQY